MNIDRQLEILEARHLAADARHYDKLDRQIDAAELLIGELIREGKKVYYINILSRNGVPTGRTKEDTRSELISYLIRNKYV